LKARKAPCAFDLSDSYIPVMRLLDSDDHLNELSNKYVENKYTKEGIAKENIIEQWLEVTMQYEKAKSIVAFQYRQVILLYKSYVTLLTFDSGTYWCKLSVFLVYFGIFLNS